MPDDVKLDDAALAEAVRAAKDEGEFCTQGYMTFPGKEIAEAAIRAYLSALPSLPSDIDGLVEELGAVGKAILYTCADCEESGNYEGMCHTADNCVLLDGRVLCEECYSDGHYPKGAPRIPDIKKGVGKLIAALRARQTPEGAVEAKLPYPPIVRHEAEDGSDYRVGVSEYRTADRPKGGMITFAIFLGNHRWAEAQLPPDKAAIVAQLIYSKPSVAALSAMPSRAVKELDLSNLLKHAFLSGVVAARSIPPGDECDGPALWVDYDPEGCPAFARIRSALDGVTGGAKVTECATEGCSHQAMVHFIRGGVGSYYCNECYLRVQALTGQPS